jgi:hypothetical protein
VVITFIDITERESAQAALHSVQDDLRLLIDSTADACPASAPMRQI